MFNSKNFSSQDVAADLPILREHNITHVVNVATSVLNSYPKHFKYLSLAILDWPSADIRMYFDEALTFMRGAVENGGRVLVHCNAGVSRSTTLAIAYIMMYEKKSFDEPYKHVRTVRAIARPNIGFIEQLKKYEAELSAKRFAEENYKEDQSP